MNNETNTTARPPFRTLLWAAGVLCLAALALIFLPRLFTDGNTPNPAFVQVGNPIMEVATHEEMESLLDFAVPLLEKGIERRTVIVMDGYPSMARIHYVDGGVFSMQFGSGDVSGIYGGTLSESKELNGVAVSFYTYDGTPYALWETDGFTFSLTGGDGLEGEVSTLLS